MHRLLVATALSAAALGALPPTAGAGGVDPARDRALIREEGGRVLTFRRGVLRIRLDRGRVVTGRVARVTRIACDSSGPGPGAEGRGCDRRSLRRGRRVDEVELRRRGTKRPLFLEIELVN